MIVTHELLLGLFPGSGSSTTINLTAANFGFTAQAPQARLSTALSTASLSTAAQSVQTSLTTALTAAALNFTAQAITTIRDTLIELTAATLRFTAKAITVTGAVVAATYQRIVRSLIRSLVRDNDKPPVG